MSSVDRVDEERTLLRRALAILAARPWRNALLAGTGGAIAIAVLAGVHATHELALLIPPFGASCVLVFGVPASPFARAQNVIGGHLVSALMGLCAMALLGPTPIGIGLGVGLAIVAMMLTDTVHPPAGANPIVVAISGATWSFVLAPVLIGAVAIVLLGKAYNQTRARAGL